MDTKTKTKGGETMTTEAKINKFIEMLERNKHLTKSFFRVVTELKEDGFDITRYMQEREQWKRRNNKRGEI